VISPRATMPSAITPCAVSANTRRPHNAEDANHVSEMRPKTFVIELP
jgi:hypothetical protein